MAAYRGDHDYCATVSPIEVVSKLLGHADITTTSGVYGHLTAEDARRVMEQAGWFTGRASADGRHPRFHLTGDRAAACWAG